MLSRKLNRKLNRKQTKVKRAINKKKQTFKISKNFGVKRRSKKNLKLSRIQKNQLIGGADEPNLVDRVREIFAIRRVKIPRDFAGRVIRARNAINKIDQIEEIVNELEQTAVRGYSVDDNEYLSLAADHARNILVDEDINQILGHFINNYNTDRPSIGFRFQPAHDGEKGVIVVEVEREPAVGHLAPGDRLLEFDGDKVEVERDVTARLVDVKHGQRLKLRVQGEGDARDVEVDVLERDTDKEVTFNPPHYLNSDPTPDALVEYVKKVLAKYGEYKEIVKKKVVKLAEEKARDIVEKQRNAEINGLKEEGGILRFGGKRKRRRTRRKK